MSEIVSANGKFSSLYIKADVTCVKFVENYILAGIGDILHVFDQSHCNLVLKLPIFSGTNIHGVCINAAKTRLLVYGACQITTIQCDLDKSPPVFYKSRVVNICDWILNAIFMENGSIGAVVMANQLLILSPDLEATEIVQCQEKSILYSAFVCEESQALIIISGTVFGELIIWSSDTPKLIKLTGHKGAIFSIDYRAGWITSTSDDRSAILWGVDSGATLTDALNKDGKVSRKLQLFGHESRVFESKITDNVIITCGEDSLVNLWTFQGLLLRKLQPIRAGSVWCADHNDQSVVVGGTCGGIVAFSLAETYRTDHVDLDECPMKIGLLTGGILAVFGKTGGFYQYKMKELSKIGQHDDLQNYCAMEVSRCRRLVALCGFQGQLYFYRVVKNTLTFEQVLESSYKCRIVAFHWLSCHSFVILQNGQLHLWSLDLGKSIKTFATPEDTTSACQTVDCKNIIAGDRRGNIYLYSLESTHPVQVLKKQLNYLGVTQVTYDFCDNTVICLGRNGSLLRFRVENDRLLRRVAHETLPFPWLGCYDNGHVIGFHGKNVILWDCHNRRKVMTVNCGGGHRSWDFIKLPTTSLLAYLKDKRVCIVKNNDSAVKTVTSSGHSNVINSLCSIQLVGKVLLLTAGEDTDIHVVSTCPNLTEVNVELVLSSHLSSVRCIAVCKLEGAETYAIFSGGGRGQIISWLLNGNSRVFCTNQSSFMSENEPDMRIMDLIVLRRQKMHLFAACSDGNVKIFEVLHENDRITMNFVENIRHKTTCVLKLMLIEVMSHCFLVTTATDGALTFWQIPDTVSESINVIDSFKIHQSGVNSITSVAMGDDMFLFASGGDDNALVLTMFQFVTKNSISIRTLGSYRDVSSHCAQITGVYITDQYLLSTSIDQKVLLFKWNVRESAKIDCEIIGKYSSSVADIQGLECLNFQHYVNVIVYGKGYEFIKCRKE